MLDIHEALTYLKHGTKPYQLGAIRRKMNKEALSNFYPARRWDFVPEYDRMILTAVHGYGGFYNAHAHIDRAETIGEQYLSHIGISPIEASMKPLSVKQNLVGDLHRGLAYTEENLRSRMSRVIETQIALGVTKLDTCIDATPDLDEDGLLAIRIALELKIEYQDRIAIRVAPNPIFGFFRETRRLEVFKVAAKVCDFLSLLPEKDGADQEDGFRRHIRVGMEIACELGKEVQLHLDQANVPTERGTEVLLEGLDWCDTPKIKDGPAVKVIHMISPSGYDEDRFRRLLDSLQRHNIGVIICPTAAVSMRQIRPLAAPTHNCIARGLDLMKRRIPTWIGTDNIGDVFVPQGDGDLLTEIKVGGHALRIAQPSVWAKLASGTPLNAVDVDTVGSVLYEDLKANRRAVPDWRPAIE